MDVLDRQEREGSGGTRVRRVTRFPWENPGNCRGAFAAHLSFITDLHFMRSCWSSFLGDMYSGAILLRHSTSQLRAT